MLTNISVCKKPLSPEDYFDAEETAEIKSEYYHGEIFAMTGASFNHNIISWNILAALHEPLSHTTCFAFPGDMRIQVEAKHYTYPDISIVCGDIAFAEGRDDTIKNPMVIIEILSDSTKAYDRGMKFTAYRNIPSLKDYILINQYSCQIEHFHKTGFKRWESEELNGAEEILNIRSVGIGLPLKNIYNRVNISAGL